MRSKNKKQAEPVATSSIVINPGAGLMRGARLWPDPDEILCSPFEKDGQKMGYVLVYGEEEPAVFDGLEWKSLLHNGEDWDAASQDIAAQYYKIIEHAEINDIYKELAQYINGSQFAN